jgi:fructose-bisphosphate aldolase/6-deoxy-5-ketofructose 1-phosphate synthase
MKSCFIPLDVPKKKQALFAKNFLKVTQNTGKLMLFAGDQRVEHLNDDFYGQNIALDDATPKHLFAIAHKARIGVFAAQLGLIARFAMDYPGIPYLAKLNSKSNLIKTSQMEPYSFAWYSVADVVAFATQAKVNIPCVGYTLYLGSEFESQMLKEAAQIVKDAHAHGLVAVIWIYPRGKAVSNEFDPHLIAGAADVGCALGADFIKVSFPKPLTQDPYEAFKETILAAGKSGVVCAGGAASDVHDFLEQLYGQLHVSGARGNATGRNVHQRPLAEAVRLCNAISAMVFDNATVKEAYCIFQKE